MARAFHLAETKYGVPLIMDIEDPLFWKDDKAVVPQLYEMMTRTCVRGNACRVKMRAAKTGRSQQSIQTHMQYCLGLPDVEIIDKEQEAQKAEDLAKQAEKAAQYESQAKVCFRTVRVLSQPRCM